MRIDSKFVDSQAGKYSPRVFRKLLVERNTWQCEVCEKTRGVDLDSCDNISAVFESRRNEQSDVRRDGRVVDRNNKQKKRKISGRKGDATNEKSRRSFVEALSTDNDWG